MMLLVLKGLINWIETKIPSTEFVPGIIVLLNQLG